MFETMSNAALRHISIIVSTCRDCEVSLPENLGMTFDEFVCHCAQALANLTDCPSENLVAYVIGSELDVLTPKASAQKKYITKGINEVTGEVEYTGRVTDDIRVTERQCNICARKGLRIKICECDDSAIIF